MPKQHRQPEREPQPEAEPPVSAKPLPAELLRAAGELMAGAGDYSSKVNFILACSRQAAISAGKSKEEITRYGAEMLHKYCISQKDQEKQAEPEQETQQQPQPAAPSAPEAQSRSKNDLAMLSRILEYSDASGREFIRKLLKNWSADVHGGAREIAFQVSVQAYRETEWLPSPVEAVSDEYRVLRLLYMMLLREDWLTSFLNNLVGWPRLNGPEDLLDLADVEFRQFDNNVIAAADVLKSSPHALRNVIREIIEKHPDLLLS